MKLLDNKFIRWAEPLGNPECPYAYRWVINFAAFALRLHKWVASDDLRAKHDHPYWFITVVMYGSYYDVTDDGEELLTAGSIRFRRAEHRHSVKLKDGPCFSLIISGPSFRTWGFWIKNKFIRREAYFKEYGHQCNE